MGHVFVSVDMSRRRLALRQTKLDSIAIATGHTLASAPAAVSVLALGRSCSADRCCYKLGSEQGAAGYVSLFLASLMAASSSSCIPARHKA